MHTTSVVDHQFGGGLWNSIQSYYLQRCVGCIGHRLHEWIGRKTRHVKVQYLWIQGAIQRQELSIRKVLSIDNPADLLTKFLSSDAHSKHAQYLGYIFPEQFQCKVDDAISNDWANCELLARIKYFAKHVGLAQTQRAQIEACLNSGKFEFGRIS